MKMQTLAIAVIWLAVALVFGLVMHDYFVMAVFLVVAGFFFIRAKQPPKPGASCCSG